jgi:hypothetical protein
MWWAAAAVVPAALLAVAFDVRRDERGGRKRAAWLLAAPSLIYIPTAIPWVFVPDALFVGKLCAVTGFALLHASIAFAVIRRSRLRRRLQVACGTAFASLLVIPTSFWERPLVGFRAVSFVDNLAGLDAQGNHPTTYMPEYWLALEDGRRLFLTAGLDRGPFVAPPVVPYGEVVVLSPAPSTDGQRRFVVTFYVTTERYRLSLSDAPRLTIPLERTTADIFADEGTGYAVLLDRDTEVDYVAELLKAAGILSWDDRPKDAAVARSWVQTFVDLGEIDIDSPEFLDRAFASEKPRLLLGLLRMGMDPDAVDSNGNTVLHAAALSDYGMFEELFEFDVDPDRANHQGRTPLDEARRRWAGSPMAWRVERFEQIVDEWRRRHR